MRMQCKAHGLNHLWIYGDVSKSPVENIARTDGEKQLVLLSSERPTAD